MGDMMEVGFAAEKRHKMMLWSGRWPADPA